MKQTAEACRSLLYLFYALIREERALALFGESNTSVRTANAECLFNTGDFNFIALTGSRPLRWISTCGAERLRRIRNSIPRFRNHVRET